MKKIILYLQKTTNVPSNNHIGPDAIKGMHSIKVIITGNKYINLIVLILILLYKNLFIRNANKAKNEIAKNCVDSFK